MTRRTPRSFGPAIALCAALLPITACYQVSPSTVLPAGPSGNADLQGNWLLAGALPFSATSGTAVAATFTVNGSSVSAAVQAQLPCPSAPAAELVATLTGTIATSGTISLQSAAGDVTFTGTVPSTSISVWNGQLSLPATGCAKAQQIATTAYRVNPVTATYAAAVATYVGATNQSSTITLVLQQGAAASGDQTTLSGTLSIKGSPCSLTGTVTSTASSVTGSAVNLQAAMADGTTAVFTGLLSDTAALRVLMSRVTLGTCGTIASAYLPVTFARQ